MDLRHQISQQYLSENPVTVTILDVLNPAHFTVKESPSLDGSTESKNFIEAEEAMQKFYESVEPSFFKLPLKDTIIVALYKNKFYRARVIRILTMSAGHLFKVYLVDYGVECSVPRECIYKIESDFKMHPFQAVNFKLLGLEPISLIMNSVDLTFSYGPVTDWDSSAIAFVENLQKGMCNVFIEVQGVDEEHLFGKLFISYENNITKCLNDELISNNFARFNEDCWENVQKIGSSRGSTNSKTKICRTSEVLHCQELSPKQVSTSSDVEQVFKTMFVSPKDGRIVAESFLKEASKEAAENEDDSSEEQPLHDSESPSLTISDKNTEGQPCVQDSPTSNVISEHSERQSITQKRFLKLQQLRRKQLQSPILANDSASTVVKSLPVVTENKVNEENSSANISTPEINQSSSVLPSGDFEKGIIHRNSDSPFKSSVSSDCNNSNNTDKKSNSVNDVNQVAVSSTSTPKASGAQEVGQQKFLKLQKLRRKQLSSPICTSSTENESVKQLSSVTESAFKLEQSSGSGFTEKTNNSSDQLQVNHNSDSIGKLNELNFSHDYDNNPQISVSSKVPVSPVLEDNLKQENMTEAQLIAHKRFQKLQQLHRKKLQSPASPTDVNSCKTKSPSIEANVTKSLIESPEKKEDSNQSPTATVFMTASLHPETKECQNENDKNISPVSDLSSGSPENSKSSVSNKCAVIPSEDRKKQENGTEVVMENVRTLQRLRDRVRMKKSKSLQISDEPKNSFNVDQIHCTSSLRSSSDKILF